MIGTVPTTPLGESTLLLTELYGVAHDRERIVLARIPTITYVAEYMLFEHENGEDRKCGAIVHFVSGESIIVRETPEAIAAVLP